MIDVALLSVIRRWRLRDGLAIREIARRTGLGQPRPRPFCQALVRHKFVSLQARKIHKTDPILEKRPL